jgi:hypothetical protein
VSLVFVVNVVDISHVELTRRGEEELMEQSNEVENIVSLIGHSLTHSLTHSLAMGRRGGVGQSGQCGSAFILCFIHSFASGCSGPAVPLVLHLAIGRSVSPSVNSSNPTRPDQTVTDTITFYRSK